MEEEGDQLKLENHGNCLFCKAPPVAPKQLAFYSIRTLFQYLEMKEVKVPIKPEPGGRRKPDQFISVNLQGPSVKAAFCEGCGDLSKTFLDLYLGMEKREKCLASIQTRIKLGDENGMEYPLREGIIMREVLQRLQATQGSMASASSPEVIHVPRKVVKIEVIDLDSEESEKEDQKDDQMDCSSSTQGKRKRNPDDTEDCSQSNEAGTKRSKSASLNQPGYIKEEPDLETTQSLGDETLQLIEFVRLPSNPTKTTITLVGSTLDRVFSQVGERPLCPICVCGPSRQGKSFLLGYMIRCLKFLESDLDNDDGWMGDRAKPLEGFKFRNGTSPETQGIWIWSRPFIIKEGGKEVAVLLIDTQGTHDEFTTHKDMNAIVGLSLLLSSQMVFNFFNNLQEDTLTSLNTYVQYGTLALGMKESTPFQKLTFLIRDWNIPGEFPYGLKGGEKFLKEKLKIKEGQCAEAKLVREAITKCFKSLDCFLMPGIGDKALYPSFTGSVKELAPAFARNLEIFIDNFLSNGVTTKEVMGNQVSAYQLRRMMEAYVELFNSDSVPSAQTMWEAQMQLNNLDCVDKAIEKFRSFLKSKLRGKSYVQEDILENVFSQGKAKASEILNSSTLFGSQDDIRELQEKLEKSTEAEMTETKAQNQAKRSKFISAATSDASALYRTLLEDKFQFEGDAFYEEKVIKRFGIVAMETALEEFNEKIVEEPEDKQFDLVRSVEVIFETILTSIMDKNRAQREKAEEKKRRGIISGIVASLCSKYEKELEEFIEIYKFEDEIPEGFQTTLKKDILEEFKNEKAGSTEFHVEFEAELEKLMGEIHSKLMKERQVEVEKAVEKANELIMDLKNKYQVELETAVGLDEIGDEEKLDAYDMERRSAILELFDEKETPFPKSGQIWNKLFKKLKDELAIPCQMIRAKILEKIRSCRESYKAAVDESFDFYQNGMQALLEDDLLEEEELTDEHKSMADKASEKYYEIEKIGCPPDALQIKLGLEEKIEKEFKKLLKENKQKLELAFSQAKNLICDCEAEYERRVKDKMNSAKTSAELQAANDKIRVDVILKLRREYPMKSASRQEKCVGEFEEWMEEAFEELLDFFELKRKEADVKLAKLKIDAQAFYHGEMGKHCKNNEFMHPQQLERLHEEVKSKIIRRSEDVEKLSEMVSKDLRAYVDGMFTTYEMKNDMGLNSVAPAIGIDLGTTFCCVGVWYKGKMIIIPNNDQGGSLTTASYVSFGADGNESIGAPAKENAYRNPENTIYDAKRIIGRKINDEKLKEDMKFWPFKVVEDGGVPKVEVNGKKLFPEEISSKLLIYCKGMAEKFLKLSPGTIKKAVITVPAYFNDGQRQATIDAGTIAGLDVLTILNEPTAAAIAYSLERLDEEPKKILIYDLGGGTFDVAVLEMKPGEIEILGVNGDTHLGGEDFDKKLMEYCATEFKTECGVDLLAGKDSGVKQERDDARKRMRRLQTYCENVKKNLATSRKETVDVDAIANGEDLSVEVTRDMFEWLNAKYFKKSIDLVEKTLKDLGLRKEEIDDVVLVGGSSRIPKVQEMLKEFFGGKALNCSIHPDHCVAYGAAVKAAEMNGKQAKGSIDFHKIKDVIPMSLGVEISSKALSVIIAKNSKIPITKVEEYRTAHDGQTSAFIQIFQGEDISKAANNKLLGTFLLEGIPPAKRGVEKLDIVMKIDPMGVLHVEAVCKSTKRRNSITITEDKQRLSREQVTALAVQAQRGPKQRP